MAQPVDYVGPDPAKQTPQQYLGLSSSDPAFKIFQQEAAAGDQIARAEAFRRQSVANAGMSALGGEYADTLAQHLKSISDKFENQGMFSSSARLGEQNNEQGALSGQMLAQRNAFADQIGQANANLQGQLAASRVGLMKEQLAGADRVANEGGQYGMDLTAAPPPPAYTTQTGAPTYAR